MRISKAFELTLLLTVLGACTPSDIARDADVTIAGRVLRQDGRPAEGARAVLTREGGFFEFFAAAATLGIACLDDDITCAEADIARARTPSTGAFTFRIKGRDTNDNVGNAATMGLSAGLSRRAGQLEGPAVTQRFQVQTEKLEMKLRLWGPRLAFSSTRSRARLNWSLLPPAVLPPEASPGEAAFSASFRSGGRRPVWTFGNARSPLSFDARLLEDTIGDVSVAAFVRGIEVDDQRGRRVDLILRSARYAYRGRAGPPDSRARACFVGRQPHTPCPLTDGDFQDPAEFEGDCPSDASACPPPGSAVIDLGKGLDLRLVVIRGCGESCRVQVSNDRRVWKHFGSGRPTAGEGAGGEDNVALVPAGRVRARYVRVLSPTLQAMREVSVFDPIPEAPPARSRSGSRTVERGSGPGWKGGEATGGPLLLVAVAALLVAATALVVWRLARRP